MITIVLIIHVFIVIALVGVVLLQRSEGGALGIGGGGGGGGFMSGRGAANVLTRTTTILAALFFMTSLGLAIFAEKPVTEGDIVRELTGEESTIPGASDDGEVSSEDLLESLGTLEDLTDETAADDLLTLPVDPESEPEADDSGNEPEPQEDGSGQ